MITKLFTEINEKMDEVEKILKDNNYFVNLEKKMKEYNDRMMALHDNEATKYINRIDKAIEYIDKRKNDINECLDIVIPKDVARVILIELLDILKGSDKE